MDPKDQLVTKLYRIRKTVHEMLKARNYVVSVRELNRTKPEARTRRSAPGGRVACAQRLQDAAACCRGIRAARGARGCRSRLTRAVALRAALFCRSS
jgi:hypothetical protein